MFREKEEEGLEEEECGRESKTEEEKKDEERIRVEEEKLVAQSRMIYNKGNRCLDMGNLRASDYKYNRYIHLPKSTDAQKETLHILRKEEMKKVYMRVKKQLDERERKKDGGGKEGEKTCNQSTNLTKEEIEGLKSLRRRVKEGSIIITETDKSKRFVVMTRDQYIQSGLEHTSKDLEVKDEQIHKVQKSVNDHCEWLNMIFKIGENWNHSERISHSMTDRSEAVAPLYLLIKDHKGWKETDSKPPPSRPVCSGNGGTNKHLSEIVSYVLEPLSHAAKGSEIDSTGELLEKVEKLNKRLMKNEGTKVEEMSTKKTEKTGGKGE